MRIGSRREPALVLVFSLLTFGIYFLWWVAAVSGETQEFLGEPDTAPGLEVLLVLFTCGLYIIYWDYKIAKKIVRMQQRVDLPSTDNAILYIVLNVLALGIINALIEQSHLNEVWEATLVARPLA